MKCAVADCSNPVRCKSLCSSHYARWRAHGDPLGGRQTTTKRGEATSYYRDVVLPFSEDVCLFWPYGKNSDGRAFLASRSAATNLVHRRALIELEGPPPSDIHEAAHSCGNGHLACVNPRHVRWALPVENSADQLIHGTRNRGSRHGLSKLTEDDVRKIRALKGKMLQREIAARFGVTYSTVSSIHKGISWGWLK